MAVGGHSCSDSLSWGRRSKKDKLGKGTNLWGCFRELLLANMRSNPRFSSVFVRVFVKPVLATFPHRPRNVVFQGELPPETVLKPEAHSGIHRV